MSPTNHAQKEQCEHITLTHFSGDTWRCKSCRKLFAFPSPAVEPSHEQELAALWHKLIADVNAKPCKHPCLRDDLHDWLRDNDEKGTAVRRTPDYVTCAVCEKPITDEYVQLARAEDGGSSVDCGYAHVTCDTAVLFNNIPFGAGGPVVRIVKAKTSPEQPTSPERT